jgi:hypothetical protein
LPASERPSSKPAAGDVYSYVRNPFATNVIDQAMDEEERSGDGADSPVPRETFQLVALRVVASVRFPDLEFITKIGNALSGTGYALYH